MKQLSQSHPRPDDPLYTVFLSEKYDLNDVAFYHLTAKHPQDPDGIDVIFLFNRDKKMIGLQSERSPYIEEPLASQLVDIAGSPSTYNLSLPKSFPDFPEYGSLVKALHLNNLDGEDDGRD